MYHVMNYKENYKASYDSIYFIMLINLLNFYKIKKSKEFSLIFPNEYNDQTINYLMIKFHC